MCDQVRPKLNSNFDCSKRKNLPINKRCLESSSSNVANWICISNYQTSILVVPFGCQPFTVLCVNACCLLSALPVSSSPFLTYLFFLLNLEKCHPDAKSAWTNGSRSAVRSLSPRIEHAWLPLLVAGLGLVAPYLRIGLLKLFRFI